MTQWFERLDQYVDDNPVPDFLRQEETLSLIRVHSNGQTQPGWGEKKFMKYYKRNAFDPERALRFYHKYGQPFAFVMRSVPHICLDIDGKNGGIETANALELTKTRAEISKSGNGFHILYSMPGTKWHEKLGYNEFPDLNGLLPGIDIRGVGAMFHFHNQRWNERPERST